MQRHSLDHLFAHGLAVFQWFNPFARQTVTILFLIQRPGPDEKAMKESLPGLWERYKGIPGGPAGSLERSIDTMAEPDKERCAQAFRFLLCL